MSKIFLFIFFISQTGFSQTPKNTWEFVRTSGQKLTFRNQKSFNTRLFDLKFVAVLGTVKNPYFLVTGRSCNNCDENEAVRIFGLNDSKIPLDSLNRYLYPGTLRDYRNDKILTISKMVYGKCIKGNTNDFVIWIQEDIDDYGKKEKSIFMIEITKNGLSERKLNIKNAEYIKVLSLINPYCKELKGLELDTEP